LLLGVECVTGTLQPAQNLVAFVLRIEAPTTTIGQGVSIP
jgi:hypothetical protein